MTLSDPSVQTFSKPPERLSEHDLVDYLISHPQARGQFKWHTLRSCMWRNLLMAQPSFEDVADFKKVIIRDVVKIINIQPHLYVHFDWKKIRTDNWRVFLERNPEYISAETTAHFRGWDWSEFLRKRPEYAHLCRWETLDTFAWRNLIGRREEFADRCPWHKFRYTDWLRLLSRKRSCLKFFKLEFAENPGVFSRVLHDCYFGDAFSCKGIFEQEIPDVAIYLIYKQMDRENGKRFLKKQYQAANWAFIEELAGISPEDVMDVHGKKYMPFFLTLFAPDSLFEKILPGFSPEMRDSGGNSLLLPALLHGLNSGSMERYEKLAAAGFDPDEKNLIGFSCNDVINYFKNATAKGEK